MRVIDVVGVNYAYYYGLRILREEGAAQSSRAGNVLTLTEPLAVTYSTPQERVLFDSVRDANPFLHFFEALWLLAGRNDARWLDQFVHDFSARFAEEDGTLHGSYGFRWRNHFDMEGGGNPNLPDQLETVVRLLKANPFDRRVVLQMWDAVSDLGANKRDVPCNLMVLPRLVAKSAGRLELGITVVCRSNDFVWGLTGSNMVQFSILQEYLAGRLGAEIGTYTQFTTNAHIYTDVLTKLGEPRPFVGPYPSVTPIGNNWDKWDNDLRLFMAWADSPAPEDFTEVYANTWFAETAEPLYLAHHMWRAGHREEAHAFLKSDAYAIAPDWKRAALEWMERRLARSMNKKQEHVNEG